ncbi:transcriptional regulator protein [Rhizobium phage RHph_TM3_3_9]|nr:transcriptional regulator protein [Rhizobium phage RHph_TM3_3_9]QIG68585.1 transcriptional regulator protein [Rhizobium phage RHph_TM3_3_13]QIG74443.1 transcriptional regulator protein [Rhizobium phage RHph_TM3_3_10]QXV74557.1 transcriptional regulator protein [Rhizobium phage RHEph19]
MKLLAIKELKSVKGIPYGKTSLYRLINAGEFPRPVRLGENRVAWLESEIDSWIANHVSARDRVSR